MPEATGTNMAVATAAEEAKAPFYNPSEEKRARISFAMGEYRDMLFKKRQTYKQFNDRTLTEYVDDSDKRLNAYVLSRGEQGKEDWQANFATRAYANKAKALLAATARDLPDMKFEAVTKQSSFDYFAADMMKHLVRHSYQKGSPQTDLFFLGWSLLGHGTVISYEGFQQHVFTKKEIKSFDLITGDVQFEEKEVRTFGEPVSFEIPLENILIKNFFVRDIQEQSAIIWWTYYEDKGSFERDWGKYPEAQFVKNAKDITPQENQTYFHEYWKESIPSGTGYLVMRYMDPNVNDVYRVIANGVELFNGPMLWVSIDPDKQGKKVYPFAKEIFEPFAQGNFFYGNSMPNSAMGEGDVINSLVNSSLDKQFRSLVPPLLVGMINKDQMDLEDEIVSGDTKIYVDDINQVKQLQLQGINDSDLKMIELISRGFDMTTLDPSQEGAAQRYVTARAAVAADERARQLKGVFFMFLESLWLQKTRLRAANILVSYTKPQYDEVIGPDGSKQITEKFRTFNVSNAQLSDGSKGTLAIQLAGSANELKQMAPQINSEEQRQRALGVAYEKVGMVYSYLGNFGFDVQIIPATLWQSSQALAMSMVLEKVGTLAKLFPQFFMANQQVLIQDLLDQYDDSPSKYKFPQMQQTQQLDANGQPILPGQGGGNSAGGGIVSDITGSDSNNGLAQVMNMTPQ